MLQKDKLNIIKAPTGSGKTYFAFKAIPEAVDDAYHKTVYLIDTVNGKEQILNNYNASVVSSYWMEEVLLTFLFGAVNKDKSEPHHRVIRFGFFQFSRNNQFVFI